MSTAGTSVRVLAWKVLRSPVAAPLRLVERIASSRSLEPRDRALLRALVGGELRRRASLRALTEAFGGAGLAAEVALFARIGLLQLLFLERVPSHAAVSETVRAAGRVLGETRARRVRELLLRALRFRREGSCGDPRRELVGAPWHYERPLFRDPAEHPYLWAEDALSMPAAIVKRWAKRHGLERALALARYFLQEPELSLRVVRGMRSELMAELASTEVPLREGTHERILLAPARGAGRILRSAAFREGRLTVQGESALRAAELVGARPGERILDLCAAPGGKAACLAETGALVVAADRSPARTARARATLDRLGLARTACVVCEDGAALRDASFDAVLVDAPCSNTGVLGARPEARWRFGPASRASLVATQRRLLAAAARLCRDRGRIVYSTCSLEPEENGQLLRACLADGPGWRLTSEHAWLPGPEGPIDGGYAALLERTR